MYITPDILKVEVLEDYLLKLIFKTKEEKIYDMKDLINSYKFYEKLRNIQDVLHQHLAVYSILQRQMT